MNEELERIAASVRPIPEECRRPAQPVHRLALTMWDRLPGNNGKWSRITEEGPVVIDEEGNIPDPLPDFRTVRVTYAAGAYGRLLCQGEAQTVKAARKLLEREREQGLIRLLREARAA